MPGWGPHRIPPPLPAVWAQTVKQDLWEDRGRPPSSAVVQGLMSVPVPPSGHLELLKILYPQTSSPASRRGGPVLGVDFKQSWRFQCVPGVESYWTQGCVVGSLAPGIGEREDCGLRLTGWGGGQFPREPGGRPHCLALLGLRPGVPGGVALTRAFVSGLRFLLSHFGVSTINTGVQCLLQGWFHWCWSQCSYCECGC